MPASFNVLDWAFPCGVDVARFRSIVNKPSKARSWSRGGGGDVVCRRSPLVSFPLVVSSNSRSNLCCCHSPIRSFSSKVGDHGSLPPSPPPPPPLSCLGCCCPGKILLSSSSFPLSDVFSPAADGDARVACQVQAQSHGETSAVFIDAASHRYLRDQQADDQVPYQISPSKLFLGRTVEPTNLLRSVLLQMTIA